MNQKYHKQAYESFQQGFNLAYFFNNNKMLKNKHKYITFNATKCLADKNTKKKQNLHMNNYNYFCI